LNPADAGVGDDDGPEPFWNWTPWPPEHAAFQYVVADVGTLFDPQV